MSYPARAEGLVNSTKEPKSENESNRTNEFRTRFRDVTIQPVRHDVTRTPRLKIYIFSVKSKKSFKLGCRKGTHNFNTVAESTGNPFHFCAREIKAQLIIENSMLKCPISPNNIAMFCIGIKTILHKLWSNLFWRRL